MSPKLADRGKNCMMIGYAHDHGGDTYRMWDKNMGRVHVSRDVVWMRRMYFPSPYGSGGGNLVVSVVSNNGAEESSAGESGGVTGTPHIEMLEDDVVKVVQRNNAVVETAAGGNNEGGAGVAPIEAPNEEPIMRQAEPIASPATTAKSGRVSRPIDWLRRWEHRQWKSNHRSCAQQKCHSWQRSPKWQNKARKASTMRLLV